MNEQCTAARAYREKLLSDPYRPAYHFAIPDDMGRPGDPNGAFFADGVYHLMYLYKNHGTNGYHWGHLSSVDLLHWRNHPDALTVEDGDKGCYSGGAFVDDDGTAYLTFWKFPSKDPAGDRGGIALACAKPPYEKWERIRPIAVECNEAEWGAVDIEHDGVVEHISCADPSNIWKMNGWYYLQAGNKHVLDFWGREADSDPRYQGDWTDLFRSRDLKHWSFVHRFYSSNHGHEDWPDRTEDDMCPSFLPLYDAKEGGQQTDRWLQLFISHNKGCQYYVGTVRDETFFPEVHGRMSWKDSYYFAPEALVDDRNRQIMWAWLRDDCKEDFERFGWMGIYGFPRVLWWSDGQLHMAPAQELERLQYHHQVLKQTDGSRLDVKNGELFRMKAVVDLSRQKKAGVCVRVSGDQKSCAEISYDREKGVLCVDTTQSVGLGGTGREEAPFTLREGELLSLDIFVDKSVIEVYANERQAICRRFCPENPADATGVTLLGGWDGVVSLEAWEMAPANPY